MSTVKGCSFPIKEIKKPWIFNIYVLHMQKSFIHKLKISIKTKVGS